MAVSTGQVVVISGPSGTGKSTVVNRLIEVCPVPLEKSVSATTREPRAGEVNGVNYWFLSEAEFHRKQDAGEFLESFEVFGRGTWYGTLRETVTSGLNRGKWIILEIDVQGAQRVLEAFPEAISIFIHPGQWSELERRLRGRGTESEESIQRRLDVARQELDSAGIYQHLVVNTDVEQTATRICRLLAQYQHQLEQS